MNGVPYRLVSVEWEDSFGGGGWSPADEATANVPQVCRSVGWLIAESKSRIVVAPHLSLENELHDRLDVSGEMTIPKKSIRRIKVLHPDSKRRSKRKRR